jgi:tRNA threonylcarbamoyl adenosine modification protein (Sua5/YciO/YrdC/YwlC family)
MIEYLYPTNIDSRIIGSANRILQNGGLVAVPTETTWGITCSIKSAAGIQALKKIAASVDNTKNERSFTIFCSSLSQVQTLCSVDNTCFRLLKKLTPGPYVFILRTLLGTEKTLGLRRKEAGVRIPSNPIPQALVEAHGAPLYSITAKKSMCRPADFEQENENAEASDGELLIPEELLFEASWELEDIPNVELILDGSQELERIVSTVLDLTGSDNEVKLIREGAGKWPL